MIRVQDCFNTESAVSFNFSTDYAPQNIVAATDSLPHVNIMPVYGLNVYSMLKHDTLVLTMRAAEKIEERILHHLNSITRDKEAAFKLSQV